VNNAQNALKPNRSHEILACKRRQTEKSQYYEKQEGCYDPRDS